MRAITIPPVPDAVILLQIRSPGFVSPPPAVVNAHLIPPAEHAAMQPAWSWGEYAPSDVTLFQLDDVMVAEDGLVFRADGALVQASVTQNQPAEIEAARRAIAASGTDAPVLDGPHVLCIKSGVFNFGHWLAEMLPMALLAHRHLGPGLRYLVPKAAGAMAETIAASLALAGIAPEQVIPTGFAPIRVRELILVRGLSEHGHFLSPLVADLLQSLAAPIPASHPGCFLWASRAGQARCLWGEKELGTILHTLGWQVVNPGALPFRAQLALFKGAARVAGVMGAGLANLLVAPPGTRVELFAPATMPDTFFFLISRLRGLRYRETRCVQTTQPYGPAPWDAGLVHHLPALLATLG